MNINHPARLLLASCLLSLLAACAPSLPTLVVDEAHFSAFKHGAQEGAYELAPGRGFIVDATGYPFLIPAEAPQVPGPNMLQLSASDGQVYTQPWDLQYTRYEVTPDTLVNAEAGNAFPGLQDGQSYLLGIGYQDANGRFTVLWAGVIDVRR
jgi:hypothetical protein